MMYTWSIYVSPKPPKRVAQEFHFAILRIKVTRASCGLSAIAELLVSAELIVTYAYVNTVSGNADVARLLNKGLENSGYSIL